LILGSWFFSVPDGCRPTTVGPTRDGAIFISYLNFLAIGPVSLRVVHKNLGFVHEPPNRALWPLNGSLSALSGFCTVRISDTYIRDNLETKNELELT
jgi:hypothetical protein